jgi:hypothetical protein
MEPPNPRPPLLEADVNRQASDQLRGYRFQIWRSVQAWLYLGDAELLALEIAEDFDRLGEGTATTYQVKDVSHNMTLRSPEVVAAIGHFWEHRRRNPDYRLQFRFMTTASIGVEKGEPFGPGVRGLEAWTRAAQTGSGIGPLREFLLHETIPDDLKQFLNESDESQIQTQLLQPMKWEWELGPAEYVEQWVRSRLIVHGEGRALAQEAEKVADVLFNRASAVAAARSDRVLHRADWLTIFDERTTRPISLPEAMAVVRSLDLRVAPWNADLVISAAGHRLVSDPPPVPAQLAARQDLVYRLADLLAETGRLILTGSTGMGKSTVAKLLVTGDWLWAGLQWERPVNRRVLQEIGAQVDAGSDWAGIVFDDYTPEQVDETLFGALLYRLQDRGVPYIVSTSKTVPARVVTALELPQDCFAPVPGLTREETQDFLITCGCPAHQAQALAPILVGQTAGHPQMIHARIRDLATSGWQNTLIQELVASSPTIEKVLSEVRTSLRQLLPEGARTLAYRLGLLGTPFRRDHALALGGLAPTVEMPGESFELLNGPWVERLDDRYFGVSPLLAGAAGEIWPPAQVTALHRFIAEVLLSTPPLTPREVPGSLIHAYQGQDSSLLAKLAFSLIRADSTVQDTIFPSLQWFSLIGTDGPLPSFIAGSDGLAIRELQYRVATEQKQKLKIAARWDAESQSPTPAPERNLFYRLRFATTMLMDRSTQRPMALLLQWVREADEAFAETARLHPEFEQRILLALRSTGAVDPAVSLFYFVLLSCGGIDELHDLMVGLNQLDDTFRDRLLTVFGALPGLAPSLMDRCLLSQARKPDPNWPRWLEVLGSLAATARLWQREDLRDAALRAQSTILHEFQHDTDAALELLRRERAGASSAVLEDQEAELLQDQHHHAAALSIWQAGLPRWAAQAHVDGVLLGYAAKKAAISAAHLREWSEAARLFLESSARLRRFHEASFAGPKGELHLLLVPIALLADHAYCLWRAGDRRGSIAAFDRSVSESESLGPQLGDLDEYRILTKLMGHVLLWLYEPHQLTEPYPGIFSSPRVTREVLSLPVTRFDHLWALLCRLEASTGGEPRVLERMRTRLLASVDRQVAFLFHDAEIGHALRDAKVERLIPALGAYCRAAITAGPLAPYLQIGLFFGLLSWAHSRHGVEPPWAQWRADLETAAPEEFRAIDSWIEVAREVFTLGPAELRSAVRQQRDDTRLPFLALRIATEPGHSPEVVFQAHARLIFLYNKMGRPYGDVVSKVVEERWLQLLENPSTLVAPRLNVPAIRQACICERISFSKASAILLVAEPAVHVRLDAPMRQTLISLRDGTPPK